MICRRRVLLALATLAVAVAAVGCMHAPPAERFAYLKVVAEPAGTTIYENDHFLGTARILGKQGKALRPGVKYLTFKAPGYFPHDLRLDLPAGETVVQIKLRPIPP
jgi:hypothetical protein